MLTHAAHTSYMFELATETEAVSVSSPRGYFSACSDPFEVVPVSPFRWKTMILSFSFSSAVRTFLPITPLVIFFLIIMSSPPICAFISFHCQEMRLYLRHHIYTSFGFFPRHFALMSHVSSSSHSLFTEAIELFFYRVQLVWYKIQSF